jgi:hypothetical protein
LFYFPLDPSEGSPPTCIAQFVAAAWRSRPSCTCNRPRRPVRFWDVPHFLHNRLTDGGEVVSFMHRPPFTPQESSWYSFLLEAESTPGT